MEIKLLIETFLDKCVEMGYTCKKVEDGKIIINNFDDEVVIETQLVDDSKLEFQFYKKENSTDDFVNSIMFKFAESLNHVNKEATKEI